MNSGQPDNTMGVTNSTYSFYKLKSGKVEWDGKKFLNLAGSRKIGVTAGYSIGEDLKKMNIRIHSGTHSKNVLEMVLKRRLSGFAGFTDSTDSIIGNDKTKYSSVIKSKIPIKEKTYYLILSKKFVQTKESLAKKIWSEIKKVRRTQAYLDLELEYRESK